MMLNGQELYCFLCDYRPTRPTDDNWRSLKSLITIYLDCWLNGLNIKFEELVTDQIGLVVKVDDPECPEYHNRVVFELAYYPNEEFSLQVRWCDDEDDDWCDDRYNIRWAKEESEERKQLRADLDELSREFQELKDLDTGLPGDTD